MSPVQVDIHVLPYYCTILKPFHCHLISHFNICRSILHAVLQHERFRLNTFPEEVKRNSSESIWNSLYQFQYAWF